MMEAALFQLRAALGDDPEYLAIRISADVLANAVKAAKATGVNAARVNDIEFALNDLVAAIDDSPNAPDSIFQAVALLQNDAAALRATTALPNDLVSAIRALQTKLRAPSRVRSPTHRRSCATRPSRSPASSPRPASTPRRWIRSSAIRTSCGITR